MTLGEFDSVEVMKLVVDILFSIIDEKAEELQFTTGEAISLIGGGNNSTNLFDKDDYSIILKDIYLGN